MAQLKFAKTRSLYAGMGRVRTRRPERGIALLLLASKDLGLRLSD